MPCRRRVFGALQAARHGSRPIEGSGCSYRPRSVDSRPMSASRWISCAGRQFAVVDGMPHLTPHGVMVGTGEKI